MQEKTQAKNAFELNQGAFNMNYLEGNLLRLKISNKNIPIKIYIYRL